MRRCRTCNHGVSRRAFTCPHCGEQLRTNGCVLLFAIVVGILFCSGIGALDAINDFLAALMKR